MANTPMTADTPTREVIVVGDKVLIKPEEENSKTPSGLYLPQGVASKEAVAAGYIVNVGPGYPTTDISTEGEPWLSPSRTDMRYVPLQAKKGDYAVFLRRDSIEVEIDSTTYVIVGHNSILLLIRDRALVEG
ncbi:MAG TPA: co-chaperone GroES family protein [Longimicrobiaceae bacterium]